MSVELLLSLFVQYGYWIVFFGILLDNAGLPLPGELLLLTFGALARTGHVDLGIGILVASSTAVICPATSRTKVMLVVRVPSCARMASNATLRASS